jgi:WD40 repeat protein
LKSELDRFIEKEEARRESSWRVDFGEEAKVETESTISAMLQLSNGLLAIAASSELGDNQILEIFDTNNDFEKLSTVFTIHSSQIVCMAEHRKLLLTGSIDCTIGFWDIANSFNLIN